MRCAGGGRRRKLPLGTEIKRWLRRPGNRDSKRPSGSRHGPGDQVRGEMGTQLYKTAAPG